MSLFHVIKYWKPHGVWNQTDLDLLPLEFINLWVNEIEKACLEQGRPITVEYSLRLLKEVLLEYDNLPCDQVSP